MVQNSAYDVLLQNLLIHDFLDPVNSVSGVRGQNDSDYTVRNTIIYDGDVAGVRNNDPTATGIVENVTVHGMNEWGVLGSSGNLFVRNTISMGNPSGDFSGAMVQGANLSSDLTAAGSGALTGRVAANQFVSITAGSENFHLKAGADAIDRALPAYTPQYWTDIDGSHRLFTPVPDPVTPGPWDIGADEFGATTAVKLVSFTAQGLDAAVELRWETGSETNNLGFHLYRSQSADGPWQRITASLVPGLGSSPEGKRYAYTDTGLQNGRGYFYLLEDVETTGVTKRHGPVAATPEPGTAPRWRRGRRRGGRRDRWPNRWSSAIPTPRRCSCGERTVALSCSSSGRAACVPGPRRTARCGSRCPASTAGRSPARPRCRRASRGWRGSPGERPGSLPSVRPTWWPSTCGPQTPRHPPSSSPGTARSARPSVPFVLERAAAACFPKPPPSCSRRRSRARRRRRSCASRRCATTRARADCCSHAAWRCASSSRVARRARCPSAGRAGGSSGAGRRAAPCSRSS